MAALQAAASAEDARGTAVPPVAPAPSIPALQSFIDKLAAHRERYTALGKREWWWIFEDTLGDVAACLSAHAMVWLDGFILPTQAADLQAEVRAARAGGHLKSGVLGGGRLGSSLGYVHEGVRGDLMGWFNGDEAAPPFTHLPQYGKKVRVCVCVCERERVGREGERKIGGGVCVCVCCV